MGLLSHDAMMRGARFAEPDTSLVTPPRLAGLCDHWVLSFGL